MRPKTLVRLLTTLSLGLILLSAGTAASGADSKAKAPLVVYASPTLEGTVRVVAVAYKHKAQGTVEFVVGPISRLEETLKKGGHIDLVLTDDAKVLDGLAEKGTIDSASRVPFIGADLILAAASEKIPKVEMRKGFELAKALKGNLAVVSLKAGPEGVAGKQAMEKFGWVEPMKGRLLIGEDGKAAARSADGGQAAAALIYRPDLCFGMNLEIAATFPADSHDPIVFEGVALKGAQAKAGDFLTFLKAPEAQTYFLNAGFKALPAAPAKK